MNRILSSTGGMLVFRGLGQLVTFASIVILSRHLGIERFGTYSFLYGIMIFFTVPLTPALNDLMVRMAVNDPADKIDIYRAALTLRFIAAGVLSLLALLVIPLFGVQNLTIIMIAAAAGGLIYSLWMTSWRFGLEGCFQADFRMDLASGVNLAGRVVLLGLLIVGVAAGSGLSGMILLQAAGEITATVLLIIAALKVGYSLRPLWKTRYFSKLFQQGLPLIWTEMLVLAYTKSGVLFLQMLRGEKEVGLFSAPMRLVEALQLLPTIFLVSAVPIISQIFTEKRERFADAVQLSYKVMLLISLPFAMLFSIYGNELILLFFGAEFGESGAVLQVTAWMLPFAFVGLTFRAILVVTVRQKHLPVIFILLVVPNIAMNLYLVPRYGAVGGGWAITLTYATLLPVSLLIRETRRLGLIFFRSCTMPLLGLGLLYWILSSLDLTIWIGAPLLVMLIFGLAYVTGWFGRSEIIKLNELVISHK